MSEELKTDMPEQAEEPAKGKKKKKPVNKKKLGIVAVVIVAIIAVAGVGFWKWHETPSFCAAFCHNMDQYLDGYMQEQDTTGTDKWGNEVSNTNAMMAVLHKSNDTTSKSEIVCLDCHHAVIGEQMTEGVEFVTGNYYDPLDERVGGDLTAWWNEDEDRFCSNENCHVVLQGADGKVDRDKLEGMTAAKYGKYNPHSQHHESMELSCTECHKGHRASVLVCTGCHTDGEFTLPDGWVTYQQSEELVNAEFAS